MTDSLRQTVNLPISYAVGGAITVASNTTLTVAPLQVRDVNNCFDIITTSQLTIDTAIVGKNGLDTGVLTASKVYAVYAIWEQAGFSTPAVLISLSATAPYLPMGYDTFRRIGWAIVDGSVHFIPLIQTGLGQVRTYHYQALTSVLTGGTATTFTAVNLSAVMPTIATDIDLIATFTPAAAGNVATLVTGGSTAAGLAMISGDVAAVASVSQVTINTSIVTATPQIQYKVATGGSLSLAVSSFVDHL